MGNQCHHKKTEIISTRYEKDNAENITGVGGEAHFNNLLMWVYRNICQIQGYEFKEEYLWNKIKEDEDKFEYSLAYFSL